MNGGSTVDERRRAADLRREGHNQERQRRDAEVRLDRRLASVGGHDGPLPFDAERLRYPGDVVFPTGKSRQAPLDNQSHQLQVDHIRCGGDITTKAVVTRR